MPRTGRIIPIEAAMHIICRSNNKLPVLANDTDKQEYYHLLLRFKNDNRIDILHYCIMDTHIHLVVWLNQNSNLPRCMKQIALAYYYHYRKKYKYYGHLWQGRYKSILIQHDRQALQCGKYIELNPVRAGMINSPGEYTFSSYRFYALGKPDCLVTPSPAYADLGADIYAKRHAYANFVTNQKGDVSTSARRETSPFKE